ncbi:pilus assembly protein N-terminal domain-containing protein [Coralliovum pocilloporae]|uniref:pilus assembly protein N-terminal domain-containing protein n=1 Tax=Coralliovum pocilloporae TaxID=3066369 RepID=UPI003307ABB2
MSFSASWAETESDEKGGSPIIVALDQAKVMRITRPAATVIIGNPVIADATVQNGQMLIITGKNFGTTNVIILDADGEPIANEIIHVPSSDTQTVTVYRGNARETLACDAKCQPDLRVGDANFAKIQSDVQGRLGLASSGTTEE